MPSPATRRATVIEVVEKGYRHAEHVLRPTRVVIAAAAHRLSREKGQARPGWTTSTPRSASRRPRAPTRSRRRTGSWPGCTTPTPTRTTRRPRSASRRSPTPTTCSSDPDKRREYDARAGLRRAARQRRRRRAAADAAPGFGDFADMFSTIFRGAPRRRRHGRRAGGPPRRRRRGGGQPLVRPGDGRRPGAGVRRDAGRLRGLRRQRRQARHQPAPVPRVQGARRARPRRRVVRLQRALPAVRRQRHRHRRPLPDLRRARAHTSTRSQIKVKIPPGVKDGTRIRLKGRGQAGTRGGPAGDLQVITRVAPSRLYTRKGDDLRHQRAGHVRRGGAGRPGRGADARRAGQADRARRAARTARSLRIGGKGAPRLKGGGRGDLIATLRLDVPRELSAQAARRAGEVRRSSTRATRGRRCSHEHRSARPRVFLIGIAAELAGHAPPDAAGLRAARADHAAAHGAQHARLLQADVALLRRIQELSEEGLNLRRHRARAAAGAAPGAGRAARAGPARRARPRRSTTTGVELAEARAARGQMVLAVREQHRARAPLHAGRGARRDDGGLS